MSITEKSNIFRKLLMIPGPSECFQEVLSSMSEPPPAHYMDDFVAIYDEVITLLKQVFGTRGDVFLITGSGSAGLEASITSLIEPGEKVISDEYYLKFLQAIGAKPIMLQRGRGEAITADMIEKILRREQDICAIAVAHNDTAQGLTNPIDEISEVAKKYSVLLIIDAVSSFGGIPIKFDDWGIDICSSASQKALSIPPGLVPIAVSRYAWEKIMNRKNPIPSRYLNLLTYREAHEQYGSWHPTPFTTSPTLVKALLVSLRKLMAEGLNNVYERHAKTAMAVREAVKSAGFKLLVMDEKYSSNTVTAVRWPDGYDYRKFWNLLYRKYNVMIGNPPAQWEAWPIFKDSFRIGHMGRTAMRDYVLSTISAIEKALIDINYPIKKGVMTEMVEAILT
ncbi:MAG: alanine--glyoxylate aminotransferase family protein [Nitrososphaerota archaeon]